MPVTFSCNPDTVYYAWQYHYPDWHSLTNAWIDSGYTFVAAHGLRHRRSTDIGFTYESEIGACKTMLIADLNLPYSRGQTEYLVGWVSPYGQAGNEWADTLGLHKYLAYIAGGWDQSFDEHHFGRFPGWINTLNGFQVYDYQNGMEGFIEYEPSCAKMNADFEVCKARGWIYHKRGHVRFDYSWVDTTGHFSDDILCHFEHISGDTTVWYVDLNGLYLYHFVQERNLVAISNVGEHSPSFVFLTRQSNGSI